MHKRWVSECLIHLELSSEGPLLIKSGITRADGADMVPVLTHRTDDKAEPYLPGSSLKGVIRSHAERIARTLATSGPKPSELSLGACNPFGKLGEPGAACGARLEKRKKEGEALTPPVVYRDSCPVCKIFGSTFLLGRAAVPDAYLVPGCAWKQERRDGVGIDRVTGGAAGTAKFDFEVVVGGRFQATLRMTNFELWQLGLLGFVLHDLSDGMVTVGSGRSRGLGEIRATVQSVEIRYPAVLVKDRPEKQLYGLSALQAEDAAKYGYWEGEASGVSVPGLELRPDPLGLRRSLELSADHVLTLWQALAPPAIARLESDRLAVGMHAGAAA
ncbi:MAG: type III CRISPR-associated RAMP protein Csx7 [Actinomycetota bacterium]